MELDELYQTKRRLESQIDNYFGGGQRFTGDRGYQDLLESLSVVEENIEELERE